jgi:hypothetical protein
MEFIAFLLFVGMAAPPARKISWPRMHANDREFE